MPTTTPAPARWRATWALVPPCASEPVGGLLAFKTPLDDGGAAGADTSATAFTAAKASRVPGRAPNGRVRMVINVGTAERYDTKAWDALDHPDGIVGVHDDFSYNAAGYFIVRYLVDAEAWDVHAALAAFAKARGPGIYS
ncbi:hypothetical protein HK405_007795, partial [Cladochytrium tenue]